MTKKSTRNAAGNGSIRKKTVCRNGKEYTYWEARITIGYDPGTGKQTQKYFTGKTQREVREQMQAALVEINNKTYFEPSKMLLSQWVAIWLEEYMGDKKYGTVNQSLKRKMVFSSKPLGKKEKQDRCRHQSLKRIPNHPFVLQTHYAHSMCFPKIGGGCYFFAIYPPCRGSLVS